MESDTFWLSPALQGPQCPPCYRPALSAKENESIQLRIHFAVKPRPVCPSECVCKWRPGSRPSPCWNVLHSQHRQAEKTTSSAGSLKTNVVSQNASGRDAFPRSSRSDPYLGHLSGAQQQAAGTCHGCSRPTRFHYIVPQIELGS